MWKSCMAWTHHHVQGVAEPGIVGKEKFDSGTAYVLAVEGETGTETIAGFPDNKPDRLLG